MSKSRAWRIVWLALMLGLPVVTAAFLLPAFWGSGCPVSGPELRTHELMEKLANLAIEYRMNTEQWPTENPKEFAQLVGTAGLYTYQLTEFRPDEVNRQREPVDAWGTVIRVRFTDAGFRIVSAGRDRKFGTVDDLILAK